MTEQNRPFETNPGAGASGQIPPTYPPGGATTPLPPTTSEPQGSAGGAQTAKDEASHVAQEAAGRAQEVKDVAADQARDVAQTAKEQVKDTAAEAREQARSLFEQARHEVTDQAGTQQQRLAGGLRSFSSELSSMADGSEEQGLATSVARQVADYLGKAGDWLEQRDPAQVLDEVSRYARRHPGTFMVIAAGLGLVAGRVARGAKDASSGSGSGSSSAALTGGSGTGRVAGAHAATVPPVPAPVDRTPSVGTGYAPPSGASAPGYAPPTGTADAPLSTPPGGRP